MNNNIRMPKQFIKFTPFQGNGNKAYINVKHIEAVNTDANGHCVLWGSSGTRYVAHETLKEIAEQMCHPDMPQ